MTKKIDQDSLMIRYLLGEATEEEQQRLEEDVFSNEDRYQQLRALEDELRYEFAQGGLSARQREKFQQRFVKSPDDLKRVDLARAVLAKVHEVHRETMATTPVSAKPSWWRVFFAMPRLSYAASALAVVAMVGGSWAVVQMSQLRQQVNRSTQEVQTARQQQDQLNQELTKERARRGDLEKQLLKPQPIFSFVLLPGLSRDTDGLKRLVIPKEAGEVRLQLEPKSSGSFQSYRAELRTLDGDVVWSDNVPERSVTIPARVFSPGDFVIALQGIPAGGRAADAGEYYFEVVKR